MHACTLYVCGQLISMSNYIEREVIRRAFVVERWNFREKEKMEHEAEAKKRAGVSILLHIVYYIFTIYITTAFLTVAFDFQFWELRFLTTNEVAPCIILVVSVCVHVNLSVCQMITFKRLDVESSFLHMPYISTGYGSGSYMKVIRSMSRSRESKTGHKCLFMH